MHKLSKLSPCCSITHRPIGAFLQMAHHIQNLCDGPVFTNSGDADSGIRHYSQMNLGFMLVYRCHVVMENDISVNKHN